MFEVKEKEFDYEQIAESGQAFRLYPDGICIANDKRCIVKGRLIECPEADNDFWKHYFDLETDYSRFIESIDPSDRYLSAAADFGRGIRILNQDSWEMLITFIISQRKNIPAIRSAVEAICRCRGTKKDGYYAFPTPEQLASASMDELRGCGLGYRTEYVYLAAHSVAENPSILSDLKEISYDEIIEALLKFKGVGAKVANCVALFGYHKIEAFPIDVWIKRVLDEHYGGVFPIEKYKGYAGVMQQYIFYFARKNQ